MPTVCLSVFLCVGPSFFGKVGASFWGFTLFVPLAALLGGFWSDDYDDPASSPSSPPLNFVINKYILRYFLVSVVISTHTQVQ